MVQVFFNFENFAESCTMVSRIFVLLLMLFSAQVQGGPFSAGLCVLACTSTVIGCATFGAVATGASGGIAALPAAQACIAVVGACYKLCGIICVVPVP
jgi:hypothetical protein